MTDTGIRFDQAGRACFVPGKPLGKVKGARARDNLRLRVNVTVEALDAAQTARGCASTVFSMAADAMELIGTVIPDDPGQVSTRLAGALHLPAPGMRQIDATDGKALAKLGFRLGRAAREDFAFLPSDQKGGAA